MKNSEQLGFVSNTHFRYKKKKKMLFGHGIVNTQYLQYVFKGPFVLHLTGESLSLKYGMPLMLYITRETDGDNN